MPATPLVLSSEVSAFEWPKFATLDTATQAQLIGAATSAINRVVDRSLDMSAQHWIAYPGRAESLYLPQYPVQYVTTARTGLVTALSIANASASVQRATVALSTTGEPWELVATGITLTSVASGVPTLTPLLFATYPTLGSLAAAINALGSGWQAVANPDGDPTRGGFAALPSTDLLPDLGPQNALTATTTTSATPAGARLKMFCRDLGFGLDANNDSRIGKVSLFESFPDGYRYPDRMFSGGWGFGSGGFGFGYGGSGGGMGLDGGYGRGSDPRVGGVRIEYVAGWDTADVPADLKQACVMAAKFLYESTYITGRMKSETIKSYSYTVAELTPGMALPANVMAMLGPYRRMELI